MTTFSAKNAKDSLEVKVKISATDITFLSNERFNQLMPALQAIRYIPENREVRVDEEGFFELNAIEFITFVLDVCRIDINKIERYKQFAKGTT